MNSRGFVIALLALLVAVDASIAQPSAERARIASERAAAKARLAEQERACREQFVVTACLEAARKEERSTLARLHRAEMVLDDAERREAAARRRQSIQERAAAKAARPGEPAASESPHRRDEPRMPPAPHPVMPLRPEPAGSAGDASKRAAEERNQAEFDARARAAQAHRAEVEKRNAARAASGKVAKPLPAAPAASTP